LATGNLYKSVIEQILGARPLLMPGKNRGDLAALFRDLGYTVGAEIGVGGGVFSEMLCKTIPGLRLYCIDAWEPYSGYLDFSNQKELEVDYQSALTRLTPYHAIIIRKFSMDAVKLIPDKSLDFVYIDARHENPEVGDDIREWSKKVRRGGIVSGHDYVHIHQDVINEVDKQAERPLFLVGKWDETNDPMTCPSWFWVVK